MLGAIIGDIIGSSYEFNNTSDYDFPLFVAGCDFTDDTICTIAIADAILTGGSYEECLHRWCRKYPNPKGAYGGSFALWVHSDNPLPYGSYGNGSAMRVSAVAWAFNDEAEILEEAAKTAAVTHNHPEGIKGAQAVAHAIFCLRTTKSLDSFKALAEEYYPACINAKYPRGRFDETCQGTVPLCFQIISQSTNFEDAIRRAISWGGDSDTIGAIVGSIAEAIWDIPDWLKDKAVSYLPDEMKKTLLKLQDRITK